MSSHLVGDEFRGMVDAWFNGDAETACRLHLQLLPLFKGLFITSNPVPVKYLLNQAGIRVGSVRLPLVEATDEEKRILDELMRSYNKDIARKRLDQ